MKKLGRIPDGGGWRIQGWTRDNHQARVDKTPIGYDFVHAAVDDHTRLAYAEIHADEKGATAAGFLLRAAAYFAGHGIQRIEQVISDNAFAYRHSRAFHDAVAALDARQLFIKPHCPWQNGKVERFNRFRVRYDRVDKDGKISPRRAGKMHHVGVGIKHRSQRVFALIDQTTVTIVAIGPGDILAEADIDPTVNYWRNKLNPAGRWPKPK